MLKFKAKTKKEKQMIHKLSSSLSKYKDSLMTDFHKQKQYFASEESDSDWNKKRFEYEQEFLNKLLFFVGVLAILLAIYATFIAK
ncbi:hypothetical protein U1282_04020 [Enterococcus cecorum]|uniref:hypothetical protein n=1 Tax=Enterococcus cecorum TaxID=44008 RepID=UPI00148DE001|nr:hypothetical protein [Enterococcus cecorum]MDZ5599662.1 hypothetical protein [Enterococcus cecorum]